jgi:hypothetical protein
MTVLAVSAMLALASALVSSAAGSEPAILVLEGTVLQLQGTFTGTGSTLSTLSGRIIEGTGVTATIKGCLHLNGTNEKDTNLCHEAIADFTGVTLGKTANCRSENSKGEKDAIGTVLMLLDMHMVAGTLTGTETLIPLVGFKVLDILGKTTANPLKFKCGVVEERIKGWALCLLHPGLKEIPANEKIVEVLCKTKANGDPEEDKCTTTLCSLITGEPLEGELGEKVPSMASMLVHLKGSFNKNVFIED